MLPPRLPREKTIIKKKQKREENEKELQLKQIQTNLYDVGSRRVFFQSYFGSVWSPTIFFFPNSIHKYDFPTSQSVLLQYNAMLASTTKMFGAPPSVYEAFETQAKLLAKELLIDFTFETALGFHFLAAHYWGTNTDLSLHFRDLSISIGYRALAKESNINQLKKLITLQLVTYGLHDSDEINNVKNILSLVQTTFQQKHPNLNLSNLGIGPIIDFFIHLSRSSNILRYGDDQEIILLKSVPQLKELGQAKKLLSKTVVDIKQSKPNDPVLKGAKIIEQMLMAIIIILSGCDVSFAMSLIEGSVEAMESNKLLINFAGPRCIAIFDVTFFVLFEIENYYLAHRMLEIQKKQALIFPTMEKIIARNSAKIQQIDRFKTEGVIEPMSESDVFGGSMSVSQLPILSKSNLDL